MFVLIHLGRRSWSKGWRNQPRSCAIPRASGDLISVLPLESQSLVQAAAKPAPSGTAARLELVSSPLEAEIRASLLRTAAEQVRLQEEACSPDPNSDPNPTHMQTLTSCGSELRTAAEQVRPGRGTQP